MEQSRVKTFNEARRQLVEQRCSLIRALAHGYQLEQTEAHISLLARVQGAIEVIDKAIGEEQQNLACAA